MDSAGCIGMVISVRDVRNPVLLARALMRTPHMALSARAHNSLPGTGPQALGKPSRYSRERYRQLLHEINHGELCVCMTRWEGCDIKAL